MRVSFCVFGLAVLLLAPMGAGASEMDTSTLPPAPPPKDVKVETECPPGSFKFDGTCWVQGDCPEGEALYKQGVCLPIPNWRYDYVPPEGDKAPDAEPDKAENKSK